MSDFTFELLDAFSIGFRAGLTIAAGLLGISAFVGVTVLAYFTIEHLVHVVK
jgi:hypothetical protein